MASMKNISMTALLAFAIFASSATYAQNAKPAAKAKTAQSMAVKKTTATAAKPAFVEPEMVFVEGGTFIMGCTPEQGNDCQPEEKPSHQVTLSSFYIGKYEVKEAEWLAVMGKADEVSKSYAYRSSSNLPAEGMDRVEIQEFIKKLNAKTGKQYRLPTEAEWEYAARGGNKSKGYKYSGSNNINDVAWYGESMTNGTPVHPVGAKQPNELGIYDMSGNLIESCSGWAGDYSNKAQTNPQMTPPDYLTVVRGGGSCSPASECRVSARGRADLEPVEYGQDGFGFRLAYSSNAVQNKPGDKYAQPTESSSPTRKPVATQNGGAAAQNKPGDKNAPAKESSSPTAKPIEPQNNGTKEFSWPSKTFPCNIPFKILKMGNREFAWEIQSITCKGPVTYKRGSVSVSAYSFTLKGKGIVSTKNFTMGSRSFKFVPEERNSGNINMTQAAAYIFPAVNAGESFEFEFKGLFPGYYNEKLFAGFLILCE